MLSHCRLMSRQDSQAQALNISCLLILRKLQVTLKEARRSLHRAEKVTRSVFRFLLEFCCVTFPRKSDSHAV